MTNINYIFTSDGSFISDESLTRKIMRIKLTFRQKGGALYV